MQTEIGKIVRGTDPLTGDVPVQLHTPLSPKSTDWSGRFTLPAGSDAELGRARLVLSDGRCGDVMLYRLDAGTGRTIVVNFWGIGSLKKVG